MTIGFEHRQQSLRSMPPACAAAIRSRISAVLTTMRCSQVESCAVPSNARNGAERAEICRLHHVARVFVVADDAARDCEHPRAERPDERLGRPVLAFLQALEEGGLVNA